MNAARCAVVLALMACTEVDSDSVQTADMDAEIHVINDLSGVATIDVTLRRVGESRTRVHLTAGDVLSATAAGRRVELRKHSDLANAIEYQGVLGVDEPGTEVQIHLARSRASTEPASASVVLPDRLTLEEPAAGSVVPRPAWVHVTWTGSDPDAWLDFTVESYCANYEFLGQADDGFGDFSLSCTAFKGRANRCSEPCNADLNAARKLSGVLSGPWQGEIIAERRFPLPLRFAPE